MAQTMFRESGQDGRSVLGMLEVQVERDPKTGATVIRSVVPVSTPAGAPAVAVFDDGRRTIHAIGGSGSQPSTEELGQILSVVDGVGMKVLLDEVTDKTANNTGTETETTDARTTTWEKSFVAHQATSKEDGQQFDSCRSYKLGTESCALSVGNKEARSTVVVRDAAGEVGNVEDQRLEEGPVTMVFLGYPDATAGHSHEDHEGALTVKRVIITEEGEEHVVGAETGQEAGKVYQDIRPEGNEGGVEVQTEDGDLQKSSAAGAAEEGGTSKCNSCQCCSVM